MLALVVDTERDLCKQILMADEAHSHSLAILISKIVIFGGWRIHTRFTKCRCMTKK